VTTPDEPQEHTGEAHASPPRRRVLVLVAAIAAVLIAAVVGGVVIYNNTSHSGSAGSGPSTTTTSTAAAVTESSESPALPSASSTTAAAPSSISPETSPAPANPRDLAAVTTIAQKAITALNRRDAELMKSISCNPTSVQADQIPPGTQASLVSPPTVTGDTAQMTVQLTLSGNSQTVPVPLKRTATGWCVD
jgi:hypothetical protein